MHLARFPRIRLAHLPTPLEPLPRLSEALGVEIWIKRDDCTAWPAAATRPASWSSCWATPSNAGRTRW